MLLDFQMEFFWVPEWNHFGLPSQISCWASIWNNFRLLKGISLGSCKELFWAFKSNTFGIPEVILLAFWTDFVCFWSGILLGFQNEFFWASELNSFGLLNGIIPAFCFWMELFWASGPNPFVLWNGMIFGLPKRIILNSRMKIKPGFQTEYFGLPNGIFFGFRTDFCTFDPKSS